MEYTIRSPKGFNYTLLKPGTAEGSELAMHDLCRQGAGTRRTITLYTHPLLLGTRAKADGRRVRQAFRDDLCENQRRDRRERRREDRQKSQREEE